MTSNAKRVSRIAILTAIGVVLLLLSGFLPTGRIALVALASLPVCVALMQYGFSWAAGTFLLTTALGSLLFPGGSLILYAAFFGYYPIAKSLFERIHDLRLAWVCKLLLYTAAFILYWRLARALFPVTDGQLAWYILYPLGAAVFVLYDIAYSSLIRFYLVKLARYFK